MEGLVPPGGGPPPHIHHREDESLSIIEGTLSVFDGPTAAPAHGVEFVAGSGDEPG
jgi:hypothetical protein